MAQDPVAERLRKAPIPDRLRAEAWDAFDQATDADDLSRRLAKISMPDAIKADLWDLKSGQALPSNPSPAKAPPLATLGEIAASRPGGIGTFVSRAATRLNPIKMAQDLGKMVIPEAAARLLGAGNEEANQYGPLNTLRNMGQATQQVFEQAKDAYDKGDYGSAAIKALFGLIPLIGPDLNQMGDNMRAGNYSEALGDATGLGASLVAPKVAGTVTARVGKILPSARTPAEAAAVQFGRDRGVPIDAGTATGNRYVKSVQGLADHSPIGSVVAERAKVAQGQALRRVGEELKGEVSPRPVGPVGAGEGVTRALEAKITKHSGEATTAYDKLRAMEQAAPIERVVTKETPTSFTAGEQRFAVDLRADKAALKPILDRLMKKREITGQLMGAEGRAATALDSLVNGPDFAPLSIVDAALGDLKSMARTSDLPELRSSGQGIAAQAVKQLDARVRARAAQAGPDVLQALEDGRAATTAKYVTADARDLIGGGAEPRSVFNRLTANDDAGLAKLRELQKTTPDEVPAVGRAVLDDILERPTSEGGFQFGAKAQADWLRLGAETKRLLYPKPGQITAIDNFFLLAKKIGESPNPSQSGLVVNAGGQTVLALTNPATGIPLVLGTGALSKILHSPKAVSLLTTGLRMTINAKPAAQVAALAQIARAAKEAGVVIPFPKAAEASREPKR